MKVLLAPPIAWLPYRDGFVPGSGPDPRLLARLLAEQGIAITIVDPTSGWRNPFDRKHPVLQGIDPWRALRTLLHRRRFDVIVSVFEGAAIPLVLLRGIARLRTPVVLWDIGLTDNWRLRERLQDLVVPRVDGIMVLGANQRDAIERRWPRHGRVEVVGHLVDTGFYRPDAPPPANGYVLSVGDDAGRDYPTLLEAVRGLDARVVLRTRTPLALADGGREGGGYERVEVVRERVPYPALRGLYEAASFVVIPLAETQNASGVSAILEAGGDGPRGDRQPVERDRRLRARRRDLPGGAAPRPRGAAFRD